MRKISPIALGLGLLVGGCGDPLSSKQIDAIEVQVELDGTLNVSPIVHDCESIPADTQATIDGVALKLVDRGGLALLTQTSGCDHPSFVLDAAHVPPDGPVNEIRIFDSSRTLRAAFVHLFAPRTLTTDAKTVHPGGSVAATWQPATDVLSAFDDPRRQVAFLASAADGGAADGGAPDGGCAPSVVRPLGLEDGASIQGNLLSFPIPSDFDCPGEITIQYAGKLAPAVSACEGSPTCSAVLNGERYAGTLQLTLVVP